MSKVVTSIHHQLFIRRPAVCSTWNAAEPTRCKIFGRGGEALCSLRSLVHLSFLQVSQNAGNLQKKIHFGFYELLQWKLSSKVENKLTKAFSQQCGDPPREADLHLSGARRTSWIGFFWTRTLQTCPEKAPTPPHPTHNWTRSSLQEKQIYQVFPRARR